MHTEAELSASGSVPGGELLQAGRPKKKKKIGDSERLLCPGAPQGPAQFHFSIFLITLVGKARHSINIHDYAFKLTYFKYSWAPVLWGAGELEKNGSISTLEEHTAQK